VGKGKKRSDTVNFGRLGKKGKAEQKEVLLFMRKRKEEVARRKEKKNSAGREEKRGGGGGGELHLLNLPMGEEKKKRKRTLIAHPKKGRINWGKERKEFFFFFPIRGEEKGGEGKNEVGRLVEEGRSG